jgi:uncharacterized protein YjiS (DUF1127 family)
MTTRQAQALAPSGSTDASLPEQDSSAQTPAPHVLRVWMGRIAERRELRELVLEKRLLNDVGLSREQALGEAAKPFWRR